MDVRKCKVTELKKILEKYDLPLHGKKDELAARVEELMQKENKTVEALLEGEATVVKEEKTVRSPIKSPETKTEEKAEESGEKKWYVEHLDRLKRIEKFGGELSELDLKIQRMMKFGELTKDDEFSKVKSHGQPKQQQNGHSGYRKRHYKPHHRSRDRNSRPY
eukprot:NODE_418_length_7796_cov_0.461868.p4 type:complete len:163 gc:universal NODE_418_length_7796_cov_0.461868:941-1429(+)